MGLQQPWFKAFYGSAYLGAYDFYLTPERTAQELAFIERELGLAAGQELLDLCCGHGRHAIPLARKGLRVTGLDLSSHYLGLLQETAREEALAIHTLLGDMREIPFSEHFDAAIN